MVQFRLLATLFGISNGKCGYLSPPNECQCEKSFDDVSAKNNELGFPGPSARVTKIDQVWYNAMQVPHCDSPTGCIMHRRVKIGLTKKQGFEADANADLGLLSALNIAIKQSHEQEISMTVASEEDFGPYTCDDGLRCDYRLRQYTVHYEWCRVDSKRNKICDCTGSHVFIDATHSEVCAYTGPELSPTDPCPYALQQSKPTTCESSFNDNYLGFGNGGGPGGKGRVDNVQKINNVVTIYDKHCGSPPGGETCNIHKEFDFETRQTDTYSKSIGIELGKSIGKMAAGVSGFAEEDFVFDDSYIFDHTCLPGCQCTAMAAALQVILNWCKYGSDPYVDCSCWDSVTYTDYGVVSYYDDNKGKKCTKSDDKPQFILGPNVSSGVELV